MNLATRAMFLFLGLWLSQSVFAAFPTVNVSATKDLPCMVDRDSSIDNCTAGEFVVNATFSAAENTPPFCMSGEEFEFVVEVDLSESNADRYDIGFFVGQEGNSPVVSTPSTISSTGLAQCSVATFPTSATTDSPSSPWSDLEAKGNNPGDACGDYPAGAESTNIINEIKVICSANAASTVSTSALEVPYILTYVQNTNLTCSGPANVVALSPSKCQSGAGYVNGVVSVEVGVWFDITKQTTPDQESMTADGFTPQEFSYTATGPAGTKVMALVGATLTDTDATGGTYIPASISAATNSTTFTLSDGETARIFMTIDEDDQTITVVESATTGWEDTAESITCSGDAATTSNTATRTMTATLSSSAVSAACTITNIKKPTVQVEKVSEQDVGTFEFTGTNGWTTETITTTTASTPDTDPAVVTPTQGTVQLFSVGNAIDITETTHSDFRFKDVECLDYLPTYYGSSATSVGTVDATNSAQIGLSSAEMQAGAEILCTYTNVRQRDLTALKVLNDPYQPGLFVLNANGSDSAEGGDGTSVTERVDVASTVTASEIAGTTAIATDPDTGDDILTDMANYNASYSCDTVPATTAVASGTGTSTSFTMPNNDITCTFTNDRKSADLILTKQWAVGFENDEVSLASSGFVNNASLASSVSSATGDNTDSSTVNTVYVGETGTLAETWLNGDSNYYNTTISCSGTDGLTDATLTIGQDDTAIDCTFTNTRKSANLVLQKQWVNSDSGVVVNLNGDDFFAPVTYQATSTGADATTASDPLTVYILDDSPLQETLDSTTVGGLALTDFSQSISCTSTLEGFSGFDADTRTLTIAASDAGSTITCTFTNEQIKPRLQVIKTNEVVWDPVNDATNPKAIPGSVVEYTIEVENSGLGAVTEDSMVLTDAIPGNLRFYVSGSNGGATPPLAVQEGAVSSGLILSGSEFEYSNDGGSTWTYTPSASGDGIDPNVTHIRVKPPGTMEGRTESGNPSFEVKFWVMVE